MYIRFLIFNLSGACELLFLLCFTCLFDLSCGKYNVKSFYVLCVAYLTAFVNCLVKQFPICLSVVVILLLNV